MCIFSTVPLWFHCTQKCSGEHRWAGMGSAQLETMWRSQLGPGYQGPCTLDSCIQQVNRRPITNGQILEKMKRGRKCGGCSRPFQCWCGFIEPSARGWLINWVIQEMIMHEGRRGELLRMVGMVLRGGNELSWSWYHGVQWWLGTEKQTPECRSWEGPGENERFPEF